MNPFLILGLLFGGGAIAYAASRGGGEYYRIKTPKQMESFAKRHSKKLATPTDAPVFVIMADGDMFDGVGEGFRGAGRLVIEIHFSALRLDPDQLLGMLVLGMVNAATPEKARLFRAQMPPAVSSNRIASNANTFVEDVSAFGVYEGNEALVGPIAGLDPIRSLTPEGFEFSGSGRTGPGFLVRRISELA